MPRAPTSSNNDPKPAVENIKANLKIYPYVPGSYGTSIAQALDGGGAARAASRRSRRRSSSRRSGKSFNTIPPSDYGFFEMINANVQDEPATSYDVELAGQLAAIGIVKGKEFAPDERMKKILTDAAAVGNAAGRALNWRFAQAHPDWAYYQGSHWGNMLCEGGAFFETPPPLFEDGEFKPFPPTGARTLDSRTAFYYGYTLDSPGMIMRIPDVGSQYLMGFLDATGEPFDGAKTYKVTLPQGHSGTRVLVIHALRQPDPLDAGDAAEVSARRQPELSLACGRAGRGRHDHGLVRARSARGRGTRQLDSDRPGKGLVHAPQALQPAAVILHQGMATERDRAGAVVVCEAGTGIVRLPAPYVGAQAARG